jgi:hypothetical protein
MPLKRMEYGWWAVYNDQGQRVGAVEKRGSEWLAWRDQTGSTENKEIYVGTWDTRRGAIRKLRA